MLICQSCNTENKDDAKFCKRCGTSLVPIDVPCKHCGGIVDISDTFCQHCGEALKGKKTKTASSPFPFKRIFNHTRYVLILIMATLMFILSFGTAVRYEGSIPIGSFSNYSIGQSTTRIYRSTTQMLFNDQDEVLEQLQEESENILIDLGLGGVDSVRNLERYMARLNVLSTEYVARDTNENQVVLYGVGQSLILLSIQLIPIIIITLTTINYLKGKDIHKILPLFLLMSGLILLFSRLQINVDIHSPRLAGTFIALMIMGFSFYVVMTLLNRIYHSNDKLETLKDTYALPQLFRYGTIALSCLVLLLLSGGFIKTTVELENEDHRNTSGALTLNDINSGIQYTHDEFEYYDYALIEYELDETIYWTFSQNTTTRSRQLATEHFEWYTLFGGRVFESESLQRSLTNLTFATTLITSLVLITNIVFLFFKETFYKTQLGLSIAQGILILALAGLSILWAQSFSNAFDLADSITRVTVSSRIAIPLIIATILSFSQLTSLIFSNHFIKQSH